MTGRSLSMREPRRSGVLATPRRKRLGGALLGVAFVGFVVIDDDVRRAYPSPERHDGVHVLALAAEESPPHSSTPDVSQDFDGDGTADRLTVQYLCLRPLFRRPTSAMLRVHSGADGSLLVAHAIASPFTGVSWCGDADGNGTDDLLVEDHPAPVLVGSVRRPR